LRQQGGEGVFFGEKELYRGKNSISLAELHHRRVIGFDSLCVIPETIVQKMGVFDQIDEGSVHTCPARFTPKLFRQPVDLITGESTIT
jgi:hypothetical protein